MMALPQYAKLDMHGTVDKDLKFVNKPGNMPSAKNHKDIDGNVVRGYRFIITPKNQAGVIADYKQIKGELAKPENIGKKAVIDMNVGERLRETLNIAYQKGYIGEEVWKQIGSLTATELVTVFGVGGTLGMAASTEVGGAVLGPAGIVLGGAVVMEAIMEFTKTTDKIVAATNRRKLDLPAKELGAYIGSIPKNLIITAVGMLGGVGVPKVMPKIESGITNGINKIKQIIPQLEETVMVRWTARRLKGFASSRKIPRLIR